MTRTLKSFHWLPRILCIIAIAFISLFALDSFDPELTVGQQITGFLIHMIPSLILIIFLVVAWRWELIGGVCFAVMGLGFTPMIYNMNYHMNHSVWMSMGVIALITLPFVVVGGLFILSHFLKVRNKLTY